MRRIIAIYMKLRQLIEFLTILGVATAALGGSPFFSINSGPSALAVQQNGTVYGVAVQLTNGAAVYQQTNLLAVQVVNGSGSATWLTAPYSAAINLGGGICQCTGKITSPNGSVFNFTDNYKVYDNSGAFQVDRTVVVSSAKAGDAGFSSKLAFQRSVAGQMTDYDFFMPATWYQTNAGVSNIALANTMTDYYYWYREDRLPLPLFMLREKDNGATFSVVHRNPNGSTFTGEDYLNRIIDGRMQFAAMGMENNLQPSAGLLFPGTEGERTLILGGSTNTSWALRSHPVTAGFTQTYSMVMRLTTEADFPTAMEHTWTAAYAMFNPPTYNGNLSLIYSNAVNVLNRYWTNISGTAGEPFQLQWPTGITTNLMDYSQEMGFAGMQLPNAAIMIREGFHSTNANLRAKGEQTAEWWATHCLTSTGCPMTWYFPAQQAWNNYTTYIRVACDGMIGLLWAWNQEQKHGGKKSDWLNACTRFGDWLISQQHADGSIARGFNYSNNQPVDAALSNTSHMVRYLSELYLATGLVRYKQAALNAGNYIYTNSYQNFIYLGGTVDNPDVPDKEAASMALRAFNALYDLTKDSRWLTPAVQTAYYYATWIYSWNIPIPTNDPAVIYPSSRATTGLSIIATGNNSCDSYAATDAFEVYRLYLFTGDTNLLNEARMMLYNTKQPLDWDPANPFPGYADPGIFPESLTLVPQRGHGFYHYLPWATAAYLEPMVNLADTFGAYDINTIEQLPLTNRQAANLAFSNNRGYVTPQMILSATAGNGSVSLNWTPATNAATYTVQRATVSGGPYVNTASVAAPNFTDSNVINGKTYYYVVASLDGSGNASTLSTEVVATPADAMAALYAFDGSTLDASGAGDDGVNFGVNFVPGIIGPQAAQFNGGNYAQVPLSIGSTNFTIALWVKTTDTGGTGTNWYQGEGLVDAAVAGVSNDFGTALLHQKFALGIGNPDTTLTSTIAINDGNWHQVAATWNISSGAVQLYVDGTLNTSGVAAKGGRNAPPTIQIGRDPNGAYFNGTIDDVRLFNRILSKAEVIALANPPAAPKGLAAVADGVWVRLNWIGATNTLSYNLKRSITNGGPYSVIASGLTSTNFTDTNVATGVTCYYVASAVSGFYESTNSNVANATPQGRPNLSAGAFSSGGGLTISWPIWAGDWRLYFATNLTPPVVWWPATNLVVGSNQAFGVSLPVVSGAQFFRLQMP